MAVVLEARLGKGGQGLLLCRSEVGVRGWFPSPGLGCAPSQSLLSLWAFVVHAVDHGRGCCTPASLQSPFSLLCWHLCSHLLPSSLRPPPLCHPAPAHQAASAHTKGLYGTSILHPSNPLGPSLPMPEGHTERMTTHPPTMDLCEAR